MKTTYGFICLMFYSWVLQGQTVQERVANAVTSLQNDTQMKHAILGLSILAGDSGEKIFEINPQTGLAPASCQKIITSAVAMDLLGPGFRFETKLGYQGSIRNGTLKGNLVVIGIGDPSLGSWRFESTKEERVLTDWVDSLRKKGIRVMDGNLIGYTGNREPGTIPGGWIWDDIGNYYGAGNASLNWRENQYDLLLLSGDSIGSKVEILYSR